MYARDGWTSSSSSSSSFSSSSSSISSTASSSARSKGRIAQVLASARASLKEPTRPVTPQSIDEKLNNAMGLKFSAAASSIPLRNPNMRFSRPPSSSTTSLSSTFNSAKRVDEVYDLLSGEIANIIVYLCLLHPYILTLIIYITLLLL